MLHELSHGDVRRTVDPASVPYSGTANAEPTENIIGRDVPALFESDEYSSRREELQKEINEIQKRYRKLQREADDKVDELDRTIVKQHMQGVIDDIREKYDGNDAVSDYLDETQDDVVENIEALKNLTQQDNNQVPPQVKQQMEVAKQRFFDKDRAKSFVGLLASIAEREGTPHLDATAVAKTLEYAARRAEHQEKISTRFDDMSDLLREAGFWAGQDGSGEISGVHVRRAMDEQIYRAGMIKEKIVELINRGTLLIDTEDSVVGQVNGLSVMQLGDIAFGRPNRITATVAAGRDGVIDIERESTLGGAVHNKGVLILTGFLSNMFARHCGLSMSARLVFEQSYQGVDGDSASSAELYTLISALAKQPIKQSIAVTGSVNQSGDIQAIGGVNEKIEGFFDVCGVKGLNDKQGVVIPKSNVQNLMLREDIVEAIRDGAFHVWPVSRIEEGIEILTGAPPGTPRDNGTFLEGTVFHAVEQTLGEFQSILRSLSGRSGE